MIFGPVSHAARLRAVAGAQWIARAAGRLVCRRFGWRIARHLRYFRRLAARRPPQGHTTRPTRGQMLFSYDLSPDLSHDMLSA